ncbi:MAG: hypothetical protein IJP85_05410 [Synergistaceae bacterium]|nr:hypothetical protein [Synergistaceae bacterium]
MSKQARELRKLRAWLGLTQEDVALKAGTKAGIVHDKNDEQERKRECKHGVTATVITAITATLALSAPSFQLPLNSQEPQSLAHSQSAHVIKS